MFDGIQLLYNTLMHRPIKSCVIWIVNESKQTKTEKTYKSKKLFVNKQINQELLLFCFVNVCVLMQSIICCYVYISFHSTQKDASASRMPQQ